MSSLHSSVLVTYGLRPEIQSEFDSVAGDGTLLGRVIRVDRGSSLVVTDVGIERCYLRGSAVTGPATGDWVVARPEPGLGLVLDQVLTRRTAVKRLDPDETGPQVLVANVDTLFVLQGIDRPLRLGRVERLCLITWDAGAIPVVLLTKADLEDTAAVDVLDAIDEIHKVVRGVDVIPVSSATGVGLNLLAPYLPAGATVGLLGESGAGKSTLVNALVGASVQRTGDTRAGDNKGTHTTTSRELVPLASGAVLVDTPGLRSVAMLGDRTGLARSYADIEALSAQCRFGDCGHDSEPGCAVSTARRSGELEESRWAGYQKLLREIAHEERRSGDRARRAEAKEMGRRLAKFRRQIDRP